MAAGDRPTLGIAHLTVVPRNFDPEALEGNTCEDESEAKTDSKPATGGHR